MSFHSSGEPFHSDVTGLKGFTEHLNHIAVALNERYPSLHRLAVARYRSADDMLQTFAYWECVDSGLVNYEARLSDCLSLKELALTGHDRALNDLSVLADVEIYHTAMIRKAGYKSSFTIPLIIDDAFFGFLFANSRDMDVFQEEINEQLKLISMVASLLLHQDSAKIEVLKSTVQSMTLMSKVKDPETGAHLQRMASYALLIARHLFEKYDFNDLQLAYLYLYAPLHDIGKINIPDRIMLKPGPLDAEEFEIMKGHAVAGEEIAKKLISIYGLADMPHVSGLLAIIRSHHEKLDGSGYPDGLKGDEIPIEARMVAVADIFDALTSERPYKEAWTNAEAFKELYAMADEKIDRDCIEALFHNQKQIEKIQTSFVDDYI